MAEAYLSYAEALNESSERMSHKQEILDNLNKIRHRAGIAEYGTGTDENGFTRIKINFSDQKEVRRLIHKERRVEFVGEGVRYHDLRRWKTAHYGIGNLNEQGENPDWGVNGPDYWDELLWNEYTESRRQRLLQTHKIHGSCLSSQILLVSDTSIRNR